MTDPVKIFLACWLAVRTALPSHRRSAPCCTTDVDIEIKRALSCSNGTDAAQVLEKMIAEAPTGSNEAEFRLLGLRLRIMECIDREFARIHPRSFIDEDDSPLQEWLQSAQAQRRRSGILGDCKDVDDETGREVGGSLALIYRGPLLRKQRDENASSAENIADRFSYVSVVKTRHTLRYTPITVQFSVIDQHPSRGVSEGDRAPGGERLCVVPVAEKREHLTLTASVRGGKRYVAFGPSSTFDPAGTLIAALRRYTDLDIALAPEFVMSSEAHATVLAELQANPLLCRLVLAGTANTHDRDVANQPWNEAVVANQYGVELWCQKKLWPSELSPQRAREFDVQEVGTDGPFHEDIASGTVVQVVDIDSLGRCVILICQDITAPDMTATLIAEVQPDWVFVPIMDRGLAEKSWFSDVGKALCTLSQARLVGICSTALPRDKRKAEYCLQIFCAERTEEYAPWRAVSLLSAEGAPGTAIHHFGETPWQRYDEHLGIAE